MWYSKGKFGYYEGTIVRQNNAAKIIVQVMEEQNLIEQGWNYVFVRNLGGAKRAQGQCAWDKKRLAFDVASISRMSENEVRQLAIHEVAHAITPSDLKHKKEWENAARAMGYRPRWVGYEDKQMAVREPIELVGKAVLMFVAFSAFFRIVKI